MNFIGVIRHCKLPKSEKKTQESKRRKNHRNDINYSFWANYAKRPDESWHDNANHSLGIAFFSNCLVRKSTVKLLTTTTTEKIGEKKRRIVGCRKKAFEKHMLNTHSHMLRLAMFFFCTGDLLLLLILSF